MPVLLEFKQNSLALLPPPVTTEQAPTPAPFVGISQCTKNTAELQPISSARIYGVELATGPQLLAGLKLEIGDPNKWETAQTEHSVIPAQFVEGKINRVRAELNMGKIKEEDDKSGKSTRKRSRKRRKGFADMLAPLEGYRLISLKCNNPSTGSAIKSNYLPVLVEPSGSTHPPVGIIASGEVDNQIIYEVDYCSITGKDGLIIAEDGSIAEPFADTFWLPEEAQSISECYLLYLIRSDKRVIISSVRPGNAETGAVFKKYQGFLID